ncbi:UDP-2,4-diacetamido-2,4,6-trideoxy-beta-L-altropyranose hydrolase [Sporosarcina sp. ANT_H38]|uniref:UDP-2,4-diacetamido-2,4, 6-trideoxy-beta-L-altropyranose hydrolase n=1 Tax=Sporosarcina sp. ANT_H38 TaxID=2597358 RepID=UPI0011F1A476|nr:UDP-2,4-diacetamido-2,4,6-trideoxy-beta-L-altropyranose hydrolase [Sporosarcina sp. ANT_H38]KAA0966784.1 UDP-2,4-diacetamido-2,4,6-trideoxy-beta-L-altropyranose hydrolase [Sporosarcina sp. ANT_H38]
MNVVIRTDASIEIGTGHVMRCLTLAKQLKRHSVEVTFICRDFEGNTVSFLRSQGENVAVLSPSGSDVQGVQWTKENWNQDAEETIAILKEINQEVDLIIVDHYGLDCRWESTLLGFSKHTMVIDDLADRIHDCDLLLDQNYYLNADERYKGLVPERCVQMLGPNYVLLREEFLQATNEPRVRTGEVNNILVFFGGTDPTGETIKTLETIKELIIPKIEINVVVGASNPRGHEIELMCKEIPNTNFFCQVNNMAELMWNADLAIGAGGATIWERCFLELPSLITIIADNQREVTEAVASQGSILCLGENIKVDREIIKLEIFKLLTNSGKLEEMRKCCQALLNPSLIKLNMITKAILKLRTRNSL